MLSRQARARHDFQDLVIPSRQEAEEVLDRMYDLLSHDGDVSSRLICMSSLAFEPEHTDWKWGWTNLRGAKARTPTKRRLVVTFWIYRNRRLWADG
jgi:hypothetical protein